MKKYFEKIKKRPVDERKKLATIFAVILTLLVVIVSFVLGSVFKTKEKIQINNQPNSLDRMFKGMEEKFSEFGDEFSEQKKSIKDPINDIEIIEQVREFEKETLFEESLQELDSKIIKN